eukprot:TRINITY_DN1712_c0_g1_i3.p1 TRINITY_DN1712_c0_g1~~TRINITY_DN1712_c0_g1_i3.p1  ORF type:complete len:404 (+),score=59.84 TRINITY_DN1712_c0_g1_i3:182-1393(+)
MAEPPVEMSSTKEFQLPLLIIMVVDVPILLVLFILFVRISNKFPINKRVSKSVIFSSGWTILTIIILLIPGVWCWLMIWTRWMSYTVANGIILRALNAWMIAQHQARLRDSRKNIRIKFCSPLLAKSPLALHIISGVLNFLIFLPISFINELYAVKADSCNPAFWNKSWLALDTMYILTLIGLGILLTFTKTAESLSMRTELHGIIFFMVSCMIVVFAVPKFGQLDSSLALVFMAVSNTLYLTICFLITIVTPLVIYYRRLYRIRRVLGNNKESEHIMDSSENFQQILYNKDLYAELENFMALEFCLENLKFWEAVNLFRSVKEERLSTEARRIFKKFISKYATSSVEITAAERKAIQQQIADDTCTRSTFDAAQLQVFEWMKWNVYLTFLDSRSRVHGRPAL